MNHRYCLDHFAISNIGYVRANNEDAWKVDQEKQFYVIADGMGGHKAGEVAATLAVDQMCKAIQHIPENASIEQTCRYLRAAIARTNTRVYKEAKRNPELAGMGTTLSCFMIKGQSLIYAHVGDSRLYRLRATQTFELLTEDHSLKQTPFYDPEKPPPPHVLRNVITRAIGNSSSIYPDIGVIALNSKDLYLLCSDGLSDYVEKETLHSILSSPLSLEKMGEKMVKAALEKGGNDNITLLLIHLDKAHETDLPRS